MLLTIAVGNTTILELKELTNSVSEQAITNATVTATVSDASGEAVSGQSWPVSLVHAAAGTYRATLENDLALTPNRDYTVTVDATVAGVGVGRWTSTVRAAVRS